jgi:hypothetical protein
MFLDSILLIKNKIYIFLIYKKFLFYFLLQNNIYYINILKIFIIIVEFDIDITKIVKV